ncbi:MAG: right-handed parallel beta-helix repeat-containing protein [Deltaproteobacteria bacterium]|nr:right-handed parallel beta-helix repeat-containing protein [Deltaproteobacteria bacterium]
MRRPWLAGVVLLSATAPAAARDLPVSTAAELTAALAAARGGDSVILAAGTYRLTGASCATAASAAAPIVVRGATPLGARIEFDGLEGFRVTGPGWRFEGLEVRGVCAVDSDCEHAFHVSGAADDFVLRGSRLVDFNAQLKVNAAMVGGIMQAPDRGLIEGNELYDTHARATANPTTKLNIDSGDDWVLRRNYIHDFEKGGGDNVSYGAFLKSGGKRGLMEHNLVVCSSTGGPGTRIGLSLGGGGTAPQFCAPAFSAGTPCAVEHDGGTLRNNIIAACSDVGIYLNRGRDSHILYNTLVATAGIDFRFDTSTGEAVGNLMAGQLRMRDGATFTGTGNRVAVPDAMFTAWYQDPGHGDLRLRGDVSALIGAGPARADVRDDYCGRTRPSGALTVGALEHALGSCGTLLGGPAGASDGGPVVGSDAGRGGDGGSIGGDGDGGAPAGDDGGGCGCHTARGTGAAAGPGLLCVALVMLMLVRRRQQARRAGAGR